MINENKVAVMTRMAAYEAGDGKKTRPSAVISEAIMLVSRC